jgi:hypothetical protein
MAMRFDLKYKLTLSTLKGGAEANHIQFNTKKRDPEKDRDPEDNKIYKIEEPITIYPSERKVAVYTVASSVDPNMTYTLAIWIDDAEITKDNPPKPDYDGNGTGIIDQIIEF